MVINDSYVHLVYSPPQGLLEEPTECCGENYRNANGFLNVSITVDPKLVTCPKWLAAKAGGEATNPSRPDWDEYFLGIAEAVSKRADCTRSKVGAVVVDSALRIAGTGYNGAYPGGPSCLAGECPRGTKSREQVVPGTSYDTGVGACIALHAEQNALLYSSRDSRTGGTIYITREPCDGCLRMLKGSGLQRAVFWSESGHWDQIELQPRGYIKR